MILEGKYWVWSKLTCAVLCGFSTVAERNALGAIFANEPGSIGLTISITGSYPLMVQEVPREL